MQEQAEPRAFGKPMWLLWSWCRGDALPICERVSGLTVEESKHVELLSHLMGMTFGSYERTALAWTSCLPSSSGNAACCCRLVSYWRGRCVGEDVSLCTSHHTTDTCMGL